MKNKLLLFLVFISFIGFSQNPARFQYGFKLENMSAAPTPVDGTYFKLTQPTSTGLIWSKNYYPVFSRENGLLDQVRNKPATFRKKIMVVGSSVAFGTGATSNNGWANRLGTDLTARGFTFLNHSIGGNTTTDVINRFYKDVTPENPDFVIIGLSLGNEGIGGPGKEAVYDSFKKGLLKLIRMCRQHDIIPIIANCYANNGFTSVEYNYTLKMNAELDSWGVPVLDVMSAVDDLTGKWVAGSFADALHPNDVGHQEMYKTIPPSLFDCLVNWDEKKLVPEKGAIELGTDITTERPIESVFDGDLSSFTTSFWMKVNGSTGLGVAFAGFGTGDSRLRNPTLDGLGLRYTSSLLTDILFNIFPDNTKNWHHYAITYNHITQKVRAYVDGVFMGEVTDPITFSKFTLAGRSDSGNASLNANNVEYKDVCVYRGRLNDYQVKELYSGNIIKSGLEIYSPLGDKNLTSGYRLMNYAPTYSYLKVNSGAFTQKNQGIINTDIVSNSVQVVGETASTILSLDAYKNVKSLPLATYPSLTELSYVKGVTSSLQTQINAKQSTLTNPVTGTGTSGRIPFWTGTTTQSSDSGLAWDNTLKNLNITGGGTFSTGIKLGAQNVPVIIGIETATNFAQFYFSSASKSLIFTNSPGQNTLVIKDSDRTVNIPTLAGTGTRRVNALADGTLSSGSVEPLKYVAGISQAATSAPTVSVDENGLSGAIVWTRSSVGVYIGTLVGAFPSGKVRIFINNNANNTSGQQVYALRGSNDTIQISTFLSSVATDAVLNNMSLEIRVYP